MTGLIRLRWCRCLRVAATGLFGSVAASHSALAQEATVTGVVVEASSLSTIGGATVRLSGSPPFFTNLDGAFQFPEVAPGRHTLTVEALGYRTRSTQLMVREDTAVVIQMDPDPIVLDSLLVRAGDIKGITIKGDIRDAETGQRVLYAEVTVEPGFSPVGALSGQFKVKKVPVGRPVSVLVEAVEYLPVRIALITERDTTLTVELEPDPVGIRLIAQQARKLEARSRGQPYRRRVLGEDRLALLPTWSMYEVVIRELGFAKRSWNRSSSLSRMAPGRSPGVSAQCLFIDDVQQMHFAFLWGLWPGEVARVEIYDGGGMVRVYTKRYLVRLLGKEPGPMFYSRGGLMGPICR